MARAPQVDKKAARAQRAAEASAGPRSIPLDLAPLLAPYKKQGRLSLRVERLPQQARLSGGRKNGDGSWSLTTDELEDLRYLLPEGAEAEHVLAIRIMSLDRAGGHTLALLEFRVSPNVARCGMACEDDEEEDAADGADKTDAPGEAGGEAQLKTLLDDLAKMKATLAAHESQLAGARPKEEAPAAKAPEVKAPEQNHFAELAGARAAWNSELEERLAAAAAQAAADLSRHKEVWEAEQKLRLAEVDARAQTLLAEALGKAEQAWKAGEAARLAAAQAQWRAESAKALAEAQAQASQRDQGSDVELKNSRDKLAALQATLAEREAALARADAAAAEARERSQRELQEALAQAQAQASARENGDSALGALRDKVATLQASLAERDAAVRRFEEAATQALTGAHRETQEALAKAEQAWKTGEAQRLAAAEARWREESAKALAAARAEASAQDDGAESEFRVLRDKLATLQGTLAEREAALARAEKTLAQAAEREERELHAALAKAAKTRKADEAARLAAAQAEWRKEQAAALNHATARYEAAETALAQIRVKGTPKLDPRTESELSAMRAALAAREEELGHLRAVMEQARLAEGESGHGHRAGAPHEGRAPDSRRFTRDVVVAAVVGAVAVLGYPIVEGLLTRAPPPVHEAAPPAVAAVETEVPAPPASTPAALRTAETAKDANLRAEPAKSGAIVTTLARGTAVAVVEERGNWWRVRVTGAPGAAAAEGWVYSSLLKDAAPAPAASDGGAAPAVNP